MAGFLGGSSSGTGGEILFPAEFIDPVTKLRVSQPENLIDTDFEYGLQPTKWETVELINNTPSFFSKSGDTTINGIISMTSTDTSREIKVITSTAHGLAVGIPINVTGTKSITSDGAYIINSIPDNFTFTYLAKETQSATASIFDLYTSIITGEFFQGSQIKISDSQGIVTNAASTSVLTVQTDSPHGFQVGTPFYFLNLNSTVSQQFDASNTGAKSFDSSNSATAQTFDGSNTATVYTIDLTNSATIGGVVSTLVTQDLTNDTITVTHGTENFSGKPLGTPLYYNISAGAGYFNTYPRGVVYIASTANLGTNASTFKVSAIPGGDAIDITTTISGTIQLANNAFTFAGNNNDSVSPFVINLVSETPKTFDGANTLGAAYTQSTYSSTIIQMTNDAGSTIDGGLSVGAIVKYTTTSGAASGLNSGQSYFVSYVFYPVGQATAAGFVQIKVTSTYGGSDITVSGGSGTQKFTKIGVAPDLDVLHVPQHGLLVGDMVKYSYPVGGRFTTTDTTKDYYYVEQVLDINNVKIGLTKGGLVPRDGLSITNAATSSYDLVNTRNTLGVAIPTGWKYITLNGVTNRYWVDMDFEGGGWMCVASNYYNSAGPYDNGSSLTYARTTTSNAIIATNTSTYNSMANPGGNAFMAALGLWTANAAANATNYARTREFIYYVAGSYQTLGTGAGNHLRRSKWTWTGWTGTYAWSGVGNFVNQVGSQNPGLYSYSIANNYNWTTFDNDQDANTGGNCGTYYTNSPWWYGACWDGNIWGGGAANGSGYLNAPNWTGAGQNAGNINTVDIYTYGAMYVR